MPFVANSPLHELLLRRPGRLQGAQEPGGCARAGEPGVARGEPHLPVRLRPWGRDRRRTACCSPATPGCRRLAAVGSFLVFVMSFVTLSFLVTTPECWVPPLGDAQHGFPLPERGRAARRQGRDHDGCRPGDDGRLGEGVPAAKAAGSQGRGGAGRRKCCGSRRPFETCTQAGLTHSQYFCQSSLEERLQPSGGRRSVLTLAIHRSCPSPPLRMTPSPRRRTCPPARPRRTRGSARPRGRRAGCPGARTAR